MNKLSQNQTFKLLCNGNFSNLPQIKSSLVRIFLSSTFSGKHILFQNKKYICLLTNFIVIIKDTHDERDYLIEKIYPLLKIYFAEQFGFEFQVEI